MTAWMRARVASCTSGDWLITRDTVFFETLASRAMSLIVALRPGLRPVTFTGTGNFGGVRVGADFFRFRVMSTRFYGTPARRGDLPAETCPPDSADYATGVIGTILHFTLPMPVKIASATCP